MDKLGPLGCDILAALCIDLMHEFELGVWRAIFAHLIRILDTILQGEARCKLDERSAV